jgi:muramoyltetrapeptide carboxypeptidase
VTFFVPEPLVPGDAIAVVAPSGPCDAAELWRGLAWLRVRYRIRMSSGVLERAGYLAGSDDRRTTELAGAMLDRETKAIVAVRGGYGAMRIAHALPWAAFARRPKWLVGFSDVTTLLAGAWNAGVASVHGPNVTALGRAPAPRVRAAWIGCLERPGMQGAWSRLRVVRGGPGVRGPMVGGNLAILHALAAAGRLALPRGSVVAIEDVGEAPYRVDRMVRSLVLGGHLAHASALVLGGFEPAPPAEIADIVAESTRDLGIPIVAGAPFGHGVDNRAFVVGGTVHVRGPDVSFEA